MTGNSGEAVANPGARQAGARCSMCLVHVPHTVCPQCVGRVCRIPIGVIATEKARSDQMRGQVRDPGGGSIDLQ